MPAYTNNQHRSVSYFLTLHDAKFHMSGNFFRPVLFLEKPAKPITGIGGIAGREM